MDKSITNRHYCRVRHEVGAVSQAQVQTGPGGDGIHADGVVGIMASLELLEPKAAMAVDGSSIVALPVRLRADSKGQARVEQPAAAQPEGVMQVAQRYAVLVRQGFKVLVLHAA